MRHPLIRTDGTGIRNFEHAPPERERESERKREREQERWSGLCDLPRGWRCAGMDLAGMKRRELQALCKRHGLPAGGTNADLVGRLDAVLSVRTPVRQ